MNPAKPLLCAALVSLGAWNAYSQGCIAVRGGACSAGLHGLDTHTGYLQEGDWQLSLGYRWLHSDRHFRGDHEEPERQEGETEVINDSHFFDVTLQYAITPRYSVALTLPFVYSDRSSLYEHDRVNRHHSSAGGLADVRLLGYAWFWDPDDLPKGNILVGIGPKFPTGDHEATDLFYAAPDNPVIGYVDQSIQPGDGGFGFAVDMFAFRELFEGTSLYAQGTYLFNPEDVNGTPTRTARPRGNPYEDVMSITDQYLARAGVNYAVWPAWGLGLSLGGRIEGVPVEDALGSSNGFRRPGYAVSIEPGISWMKGNFNSVITTPVAVYRNRQRSVADKRWTEDTGIHRHGDAAFADFTVNSSISWRF